MEYQIALTEGMDLELRSQLLSNLDDEDARLAIWSPAQGSSRLTAVLATIVEPEPGEVKRHGNVTVENSYIERATEKARSSGRGLALIHTHPGGAGWQCPSGIDQTNERELLGRGTFGVTGQPLIGLILSGEGRWSGRFYPVDKRGTVRREECSAVRVVGKTLNIHFNPRAKPPPKMTNRQLRSRTMWGELRQADIMRLHVGIIGAGSVGGIVAEILARMGVGRITVFDFDVVEDHNLDRLLFATREDARSKVRKASLLERHLPRSATTLPSKVTGAVASIVEEEGYRLALDCDVLFSCVDRNWPRQVLNHISYTCLIPVIDGGVSIRIAASGELIHAVYRAQTVGPSRPCLMCLGMYDGGRIQLEREGMLDQPAYIEQLGEEGKRQLEQERQNIMPFATGLASLETLQFSELMTGIAGWGDLGLQQFDLLNADLQSDHGRKCHADCEYSRMLGKGSLIPPYLGVDQTKLALERSLSRRSKSLH
jgi:molybdopterin-synthase adenylyltransferase